MKAASTLCVALVCSATVALARGPESTYPVQVDSGWNLLSVPASVSNASRAFLFPSAVSPAYVYQPPAGYVVQDTLHNGVGLWLKFNSAGTVLIEGGTLLKDMIEVQEGWNIIGGLSVPVLVSVILTDPPGIITSQFFGYSPGGGYQQDTVLQPGLGYWVKVSQAGTMILSSSGLPCPGIPTVDYAGKVYNTVLIGSQCWLRENLDVGVMVPGSQDQMNNGSIEKYCYDDDTANCGVYGGLYQWSEAMQYVTTQGATGICPPGWHIPTYTEFQTLISAVGGNGNALKATGQGSGSGAGTNESGFSALLAGNRNIDGSFGWLGRGGVLWSSTLFDAAYADYLYLSYYDPSVLLTSSFMNYGFSVRCLKD
jgi:uncharacterized protein (TIGR02145 family)